MTVVQIAKVCHEANRSYCESIGDFSQTSWNDAPEWQKQSAIFGVLYHQQYPDSKPEDSHKSWFKQKEADGWKYGKVKDADKKEHPCIVDYEKLPKEQQLKDDFFLTIVRAMHI